MPSHHRCDYWVFREGRNTMPGETLRAKLLRSLRDLRHDDRDTVVDALLRAGELETALADQGSADAAAAAKVTDLLASSLLGAHADGFGSAARAVQQLDIPDQCEVSTPEGFAYYALHPLAYAEMAESIPLHGAPAAVVGIRSIGSTLSAVVTAALACRGVRAARITVRPTGHPYSRSTSFTPAQLRWIAAQRARRAAFLVVDEGPGISGSSFLSVGDALLQAGVERRSIRLLCSHPADPDTLTAPNAGERWRGFQSLHPGEAIPELPAEARTSIGAGEWRTLIYENERDWPASWTAMERVKFLSPDQRRLYKFAGHGRSGSAVAERARLLSESGYGPEFFGLSGGFAAYAMVDGSPARREQLNLDVMERIADYCALRAIEFHFPGASPQLHEMVRYNYEQVLDEAAPDFPLLGECAHPVICDARMQPHEWVCAGVPHPGPNSRVAHPGRFCQGGVPNSRVPHPDPVSGVPHPDRLWKGGPPIISGVPHSDPVSGVPHPDRRWKGGVPIIKVDADTHGDDHFFPGPCDIAWDLAGAIVEWDMNRDAADALLRRYRQRSGDDAAARIQEYVTAYTVFRTAYCSMASFAMRGSAEEPRLQREAQWYRSKLDRTARIARTNQNASPACQINPCPAA